MHLPTLLACMMLITAQCPAAATETIVMIRHAEKPDGGLGQLSCQGLNRALALPDVLLGKFGSPSAIFAPNPGIAKNDQGHEYNYIRPLATIEPTAIRLGLPVNTKWGFEEIDHLKKALLHPKLQDATVFVAWEHRLLEKAARELVEKLGGDPTEVPNWGGYDFDSIYIIRISENSDGKRTVSFSTDRQNLDHQPSTCPGQMP